MAESLSESPTPVLQRLTTLTGELFEQLKLFGIAGIELEKEEKVIAIYTRLFKLLETMNRRKFQILNTPEMSEYDEEFHQILDNHE